jgi:hypothetical protein
VLEKVEKAVEKAEFPPREFEWKTTKSCSEARQQSAHFR